MNMLGNLNHVVFFFMGEKNIHACSSYMCGIFFHLFFFFKSEKKTTHVSRDSRHTWNFLIIFEKLLNHHTSPMNILGFFLITIWA